MKTPQIPALPGMTPLGLPLERKPASPMTDAEVSARGLAFEAGYFDAYLHQGRARWALLHIGPLSDREMSDYWEGFHAGGRDDRNEAAR